MIRYDAFTKDFDGRRAVDALTLDVPPGTVVAVLGPNGSGKTTILKAAAGLVRPTAGTVRLGDRGLPASDPAARQHCAFLPQRVAFPEALTGREVVEFYRRLRGAGADSTDRALALAALNGASRRAVGTYSGGMLQRLGLAVTMITRARVLLLDEPTAALDPEGLQALYPAIEARRADGAAVLFSSHQLGDVTRLADRIAVLAGGRLMAEMTAGELTARLADRGIMRVRLRAPMAGGLDALRAVAPHAKVLNDEVIVPGAALVRPVALDRIRATGAEILDLTTQEGRLEDFYCELLEPHP